MKKRSSKSKGKSRSTSAKRWRWITLIGAGLIFPAYIWISNNHQRIRRITNGILHVYHHEIPDGYEVHGIDISRYQGKIDWEELSNTRLKGYPISFVFMKSTEGASLRDSHFDKNWKEAQEAGLKKGAYHYFKPLTDPGKQAAFFISNTPLKTGDFPPVLDFEEDGNLDETELRRRLIIWLELVEKHYKVKPIIYCNADYFKNHIQDKLDGYPIWVAHFKTKKPRIHDESWHFWQYSESGKIAGIKGHVDLNVFNGSHEQLESMLIMRQ